MNRYSSNFFPYHYLKLWYFWINRFTQCWEKYFFLIFDSETGKDLKLAGLIYFNDTIISWNDELDTFRGPIHYACRPVAFRLWSNKKLKTIFWDCGTTCFIFWLLWRELLLLFADLFNLLIIMVVLKEMSIYFWDVI